MIITGASGEVVNILMDVTDLSVLKCALMATDVKSFENFIGELQNRSILSNELNYHSVPGHAIVTISHFEANLQKFKAGAEYAKILKDAEITTPVN